MCGGPKTVIRSLKEAKRGRKSNGMTAGYSSTGFEGGKDHESKNVGGLWKPGKERKCLLPKPPERRAAWLAP